MISIAKSDQYREDHWVGLASCCVCLRLNRVPGMSDLSQILEPSTWCSFVGATQKTISGGTWRSGIESLNSCPVIWHQTRAWSCNGTVMAAYTTMLFLQTVHWKLTSFFSLYVQSFMCLWLTRSYKLVHVVYQSVVLQYWGLARDCPGPKNGRFLCRGLETIWYMLYFGFQYGPGISFCSLTTSNP